MRLLLDTHIFLWVVSDNKKLGRNARKILSSADEIFISAASVWEIAIKSSAGKIKADAAAMSEAIELSGFLELPVYAAHAAMIGQLPLHHNDPFDRLLLAQAMAESLKLVTVDLQLPSYGSCVLLL